MFTTPTGQTGVDAYAFEATHDNPSPVTPRKEVKNKMLNKKQLAMAATMLAGIATATGLTPHQADAWSPGSLPDGYQVQATTLTGGCTDWKINGVDLGSDCNAGFQAALDSYINATICRINPTAGGALCLPTTSTTTTTQATTTTQTTTAAATTTTTQQPPAQQQAQPPADTTTTTTVQTVTITTPSTTTTETVTLPTANDPTDLITRVTLLEQRLLVLEARVQALEDQTGTILGEEKNEPPFTNPA